MKTIKQQMKIKGILFWTVLTALLFITQASFSQSRHPEKEIQLFNLTKTSGNSLKGFEVTQNGNTVAINWESRSEKAPGIYFVQSSTDGVTFQNIGMIKVEKVAFFPQDYSFSKRAQPESATYRLLRIYENGSCFYSPMKEASVIL